MSVEYHIFSNDPEPAVRVKGVTYVRHSEPRTEQHPKIGEILTSTDPARVLDILAEATERALEWAKRNEGKSPNGITFFFDNQPTEPHRIDSPLTTWKDGNVIKIERSNFKYPSAAHIAERLDAINALRKLPASELVEVTA